LSKISIPSFGDGDENRTRVIVFIIAALIHLLLLLFLVFKIDVQKIIPELPPTIMKLADIEEYIPPPPPPPPPDRPVVQSAVENIAQNIIETDLMLETSPDAPVQTAPATPVVEEFLPQHKISIVPHFDDNDLKSRIVYPPIAQRSGIEGNVILELYVDRAGYVRNISVLKETPAGMGFAEAAVRAFQGLRGKPAEANGQPVASRYRYPVTFKLVN
jgi:protein TonB